MEAGELLGQLQATANSQFIRVVRAVARDGGVQFALRNTTLRPLAAKEIEQLEARGNFADDWSRVRVATDFIPEHIRHSDFHGDVVLGRFDGRVSLTAQLDIPTGIYRSTVSNCVIGHNSLIRNVGILSNYVVGPGSILSDCGRIVCSGRTAFGNGQELSIAIETGGREVPVFAEIDVAIAAQLALARPQRDLFRACGLAVADYVAKCTSDRGIIEGNATIRHTQTITNVYIGSHADIDGATLVEESSILSSAEEPARIHSGSCVVRSLIQWGCHVATMALVDSSVMTEHSRVERHGKVTASILGPNTGVAEGEVTSCLLGPFVGFHHQALLIAAFWPEGKGNVGYGANVGSNHTSKAPDQEFWPGEGLFLGLGVNIKYPADLSRAPYSIIATGVTTLPQKVTFPFSLINSPSATIPGLSPAYNEIIPAWLLVDNMFALKRNEGKYKARNKARRTHFEFEVFRPHIVDLMIGAQRRLQAVEPKESYTDRDIEGLGKNILFERYRQPAIDAYTFYVKYYAWVRLFEEAQRLRQSNSIAILPDILTVDSTDSRWEHARRILQDEFRITDPLIVLRELPEILERVARDVERSKAKDDERGVRIIDDYATVHESAAADKFVQQCWKDTRRIQSEVNELIQACSK